MRLETQDHPESQELEDPKARGVRRERLAPLEPRDPPVQRDPLGMTVQRATRVRLDSLEILAHPVSLVLLALTESLERREKMVNQANQDLQDHQVKPAPLDHLAREDLRERLVQRAGKGRRALRERLELRVPQVKPDQSDPKDLPENLVPKV